MPGTAARIPKPILSRPSHQYRLSLLFTALQRTSSPVQNIGHLFHGEILASPSQVLRYGFRTVSGITGGVSVEACPVSRSAVPTASKATYKCILQNAPDWVQSESEQYGERKRNKWRRRGWSATASQVLSFLDAIARPDWRRPWGLSVRTSPLAAEICIRGPCGASGELLSPAFQGEVRTHTCLGRKGANHHNQKVNEFCVQRVCQRVDRVNIERECQIC